MTARARTTVGFVGLGQMGKPMALNLIHDDIDLLVTAKTPEAYGDLRARGARIADTLADFRHADIVVPVSYTHLTLPTNREV